MFLLFRYRVIKKIGAGSFADVYKAIEIKKDGNSDPHEYVAIKRIRSIRSNKAMLTEINILKNLGGKAHIPHLLSSYRHKSIVSLILPYFEEVKFKDYYKVLDQRN